MPELPEVETMVRGIRPHAEGRLLLRAGRTACACRPISVQPSLNVISRRVRGRTIVEAARLAKRVVLKLDSGDAFVIEPRMTGLMLVADPPDREHLRFQWELGGVGAHDRLLFWDRRGLGTIRFYKAGELEEALRSKLGPDALAMTPGLWRTQLKRTSRPIKVALLDQKLVAGIGNLYASEILHRSHIRPQRRADRLTRRDIEQLHEATQLVLNEAIRYEGSTLGDGTYRNALNENGSYQAAHRVYARADQPCFHCESGTIRRIVQAQRSTFFCPNCQR